MIKRRYGWMLRIGGHIMELTQSDVTELFSLLEEATRNSDQYKRRERIVKAGSSSMEFFRTMNPQDEVRYPLSKVKERSISSRLALLKRTEGITFTCHRDMVKSELCIKRIS